MMKERQISKPGYTGLATLHRRRGEKESRKKSGSLKDGTFRHLYVLVGKYLLFWFPVISLLVE